MSEPILGESLRNELKELVREVIREELANSSNWLGGEKDTLLTPEQAAAAMGVSRRALSRMANKLPFTRRLNRKTLRFQGSGLNRWIAAKKPDSLR